MKKILISIGLLVVGLFVYIYHVTLSERTTMIWITVSNKSQFSVDKIELTGPLARYTLTDFKANTLRVERLDLKGEGVIKYSVVVCSTVKSGILLGYIRPGIKQHATIFIGADVNVRTAITENPGVSEI